MREAAALVDINKTHISILSTLTDNNYGTIPSKVTPAAKCKNSGVLINNKGVRPWAKDVNKRVSRQERSEVNGKSRIQLEFEPRIF